ncbi:MFS family permease [Thermocatellispora tengchongensis]|uniref:MFS family permease n=1 Tax=Thermocatellispora tengchongensis TaxID=1073253 RepID=A0A840P4E7_9ACTN|nr:MFS transporter [Thermocatellispora tengchongensis]MBB5132107.1 MFS family permease [Thermocatellispora tengchongensis]
MTLTRDAAGGTRPRTRPGATLAVVLLGYLTLPMLMSGTAVALPRIGADLGATGAALQWVVVGYFLAASSLMLVAGSLGDVLGRRRVFVLGAALYAAGALASALAPGILVLDVARTLSGAGAAGVMATGGAILGGAFTGPARTRAFAAMGTTAGVGMAIGPTLSGWLIGALGWRATFAAFAAAGVLICAGGALIAEARAAARPRIDGVGMASLIGALALVMAGVNQAAAAGWGSLRVLAPLAAGAVLLVLFVLAERRSAHPVFDLGLLRDRPFLAWCLACLSLAMGPAGALAYLPTYLQGAGGMTAGAAGAAMLLLTGPVLVLPPAGAWLLNRGVPAGALAPGAVLLIAAGNAWLTTLHPAAGVPGLAGPLLTLGAGMGLLVGVADSRALERVPPDRLGMASGLLNTVRGAGSTLATTLTGTALANLVEARTGSAGAAARIVAGDPAGPADAAHLTAAWHTVSWSAAALCAAATLATALLLRRP